MIGERKVWVIEWLHPDNSWHIDNDFVVPAYFSWEEVVRAIEIRNRDISAGIEIKRRINAYVPSLEAL